MGEGVTPADVYAAECEAVRLEAMLEEAEGVLRRTRQEFLAQVRYVRDLARALGEQKHTGGTDSSRTLFDHEEAESVQPEPQTTDGPTDPAGPAEHEQRPHRKGRRAADRAG